MAGMTHRAGSSRHLWRTNRLDSTGALALPLLRILLDDRSESPGWNVCSWVMCQGLSVWIYDDRWITVNFAKINPVTNASELETSAAQIAIAIPCFNEAPAIASVIERYRAVIPGAELFVFDNNSTDGTGEIARRLGARVIEVPEQG